VALQQDLLGAILATSQHFVYYRLMVSVDGRALNIGELEA
jgi:hypothetical protein